MNEDSTQAVAITHGSGRLWLVPLIAVLGLTGAIRYRTLGVPLERDEGEYAYAGQLILQGIPPYGAVYNMKMPGTYAAYAVMLALLGEGYESIHLGLLIVNFVTAVLLFLLVRSAFDTFTGTLAATTFAVLCLSRSVQGLFANAEHFVILFAIPGIWVLLRAGRTGSSLLCLIGGLLLGTAFMMKQHGAAFCLFGLFWLARCYLGCRPVVWRHVLLRLGLYGLGCAIPLALTCGILALAGVFGKFWFWTFTYAAEYVSEKSFGQMVGPFVHQVVSMGKTAFAAIPLAIVGLVSPLWNRSHRNRTAWLLLLVTFSLTATCIGFRFRPHYFILMIPAGAVCVGLGGSALRTLARDWVPGWLSGTIAVLLFLLATVPPLLAERSYLFRQDPTGISRSTYGSNPFPESLEIARYVRENTEPNEVIAVFGSEPQIYFYSRRRSATGYIYMYPLMESHPYAAQMQDEMIREVESSRPTMVVFVWIPPSWSARDTSEMRVFEWIRSYTAAHFRKVGRAEIALGQTTRWFWGSEARTSKPSTQWRIEIFRSRHAPP